ncbi:MAG: hypothetical protein J2P51_07425, partial [Hyphomicrobiaceae bacterium]|nr:hypothetical protein [Hyphomicrobiaceae bacterium]
PPGARSASAGNGAIHNGRHQEQDASDRRREVGPELEFEGHEHARAAYSEQAQGTAFSEHSRNEPALSSAEPAQLGEREPGRAATRFLGQLQRAWARLLPGNPDRSHELEGLGSQATNVEPARIASRFARPSNEART